MDRLTFYRYTTWGMLALNMVLLVCLFFPLLRGPGGPNGPGPGMAEAMNRLGLDTEQHAAFKASAKAHQVAMEDINQQQREMLRDYFGQLTGPESDRPTPLSVNYAQLEAEKVDQTYQHFLTVRDLLRADQAQQYRTWVDFSLQRLLIGGRPKRPKRE